MRDLAEEARWYRSAVLSLKKAQIPFLIGGAYALWKYTGVRRPTKDLDLFLRARHLSPALKVMLEAGCRTEITARHWIGKAFHRDSLVDFILGMANGVGQVDDTWFERPVITRMFGVSVPILRPEDLVWAKAFVMERDRYDGADIAHLLWSKARTLDWKWLVKRFEKHPAVLLNHLVLFGYIYPDRHKDVPRPVFRHLLKAIEKEQRQKPSLRFCRGTLFSRYQYMVDVEKRGYVDSRLLPYGTLTAAQLLE
jgi:hypothetical protein